MKELLTPFLCSTKRNNIFLISNQPNTRGRTEKLLPKGNDMAACHPQHVAAPPDRCKKHLRSTFDHVLSETVCVCQTVHTRTAAIDILDIVRRFFQATAGQNLPGTASTINRLLWSPKTDDGTIQRCPPVARLPKCWAAVMARLYKAPSHPWLDGCALVKIPRNCRRWIRYPHCSSARAL
jgi:hypothetical protein